MSVLSLRNVPEDLRNQYKAALAKQGRSMTADLIAYMRRVVAESEKAKKK